MDYAAGVYVSETEYERRLEGQQFTKLGRKYQHDWLYLQSRNSDKRLPQSLFTGQMFLDDDNLHYFLWVSEPFGPKHWQLHAIYGVGRPVQISYDELSSVCWAVLSLSLLACRIARNWWRHQKRFMRPFWTAWVHFSDSYPIDISLLGFNFSLSATTLGLL